MPSGVDLSKRGRQKKGEMNGTDHIIKNMIFKNLISI